MIEQPTTRGRLRLSYSTPTNGMRAYSAPDPSQPAVATIPGGEPLEAIAWRGDWAQIRCTNGWTAWVDGRILRAQDAATAAPTPFVATHAVPAGGLSTWSAPDGSQPPTHTVEAGLPVRVLTRQGGWAHVEFSNGWRAWLDGNRLVASDGRSQPSAASPAAVASRTSVGAALARRTTIGVVGAAGAAIVVASTFLPWLTFGPVHFDAWDLPVRYLVAGTGTNGGIKAGLVLLVPAVAALLALTRWSIPRWTALALGGVATNAAVFAVARALRPNPHPNLGFGVLAAAAGGLLIAWDGWRSAR